MTAACETETTNTKIESAQEIEHKSTIRDMRIRITFVIFGLLLISDLIFIEWDKCILLIFRFYACASILLCLLIHAIHT